MSRRIDRVEEACREELSNILRREVKDPRIGFVTITKVKVTADLRHAKVYLSIMGTEAEVENSIAGLESARGYLRSRLGEHLRLKFLPELELVRERVAEEALRLNEIMRKVKEDAVGVIESSEIEGAAALIKDCREVLVIAHEHPDGDAVGSMLGMSLMLEKAGKNVRCSWPPPGEKLERYRFLPGWHLLVMPSRIHDTDLVITVDCSNIERLEGLKSSLSGKASIINIDHHPDNTFFGDVNMVNPRASSVAEILYLYAVKLGLALDEEAAICLYVGILMDTGRFQFRNTSETTLRIASEIVGMGINPNFVFQNVYQGDSLQYLRLCGHVLSNSVFDDDLGMIYAYVTQDDMKSRGVTVEEIQDLVDYLRTLKNHRIAVLFKELEGGEIRVSMRSRDELDVGDLARRLGGGGHSAAAAYTSGKKDFGSALAELRGEINKVGWDSGGR